jgi:predicted kinase
MTRLLVALCGLAFSGKSTIARQIAEALAADLISYDAINAERGFDGGTVIADGEWEKTSLAAASRARAALAAGRGVVIDDTFSHRFLRERFRSLSAAANVPFVLVFADTPLAVIEARIADNARTRRRGHIAPEVFVHHRDRFQFPGDDEAPVRVANPADLDRWLTAARADILGS